LYCSDRVAEPVGVEDRGVDVAAGDGVSDAVDDEAPATPSVLASRLRSSFAPVSATPMMLSRKAVQKRSAGTGNYELL